MSNSGENSQKLVAAFNEEIARILKDGLTDQELADAKSGFLQTRSRYRSQDDYLLDKLSKYLVINRTFKWDADQEKVIEGLTTAQINTTLKKWIKPEKIIMVEAGDFESKKN